MSTPALRALGPVRHACTGCGGSCETVRPRVLPDEAEGIGERARALGVDDAIVEGHLRQEQGRCVFLDEASRCRLHLTFGADSKPRICRQYPVVVLDTGGERRIGLDPGCYTAITTWRTGPPSDEAWVVAKGALAEAGEREEAAVVGLLGRPGATVAQILDMLVPGGLGEGLPDGLSARLATRIAAADLATLLARPEVGPAMRQGLMPLCAVAPRPWALAAEEEGFGIDAVRRLVWLRLMPGFPPSAAALLGLCGVVAAAWADPRPAPFGAAVAAWTRAVRAPMFRKALVPDSGALQWLATGR